MPSDMPSAEHEVDLHLVQLLLRDQFPELAGRRLEVLAHGWDNELVRLGDDLLVRLPRRTEAAALLHHEQRWLPELAPRLPLPVPEPVRRGRPGRGYPWAWSITAYLDGENAAEAERLDTRDAARTLGDVLGRLHLPAPPDAPVNPVRGVELARRDQAFRTNVELAGDTLDPVGASAVWQAALRARPWQGAPVWVHGDLHPANLLVRDGRISALLDFGDLTSGDPATDLAVAWLLLPRQDRPAFWVSYAATAAHRVDDDLRARSRGWALAFVALFLARSADNPLMLRIGTTGAARVLEA